MPPIRTAAASAVEYSPALLVPGHTCWRVERAHRAAFIVDAADYFATVKAAMLKARHSIFLLGWDFDTRIALEMEPADPTIPNHFGEFLDWLVKEQPGLRIHVLKWDFSMIFALEREIFPTALMDLLTHPHVLYRLDGEHPAGACHHQKLVVIDDRLAFCGGLDLTANRWDTRAHLDHDPRRKRPNGDPYDPFHDIMMAVDGPAAAALGELARYRWSRGTGEPAPPPIPIPVRAADRDDPWPDRLRVDLHEIDVGIARTLPRHETQEEVREVEALYLASIAAARRHIYIECQYFTSERIGEALLARLGEPDGPEIVVVTPLHCSGWLEEEFMGRARRHLVHRLRIADIYGRFGIYVARTAEGTGITIHSKTMVVDDRFLRIGSSNLNNRSMGFDTECDLGIEITPGSPGETAGSIAVLRYRDGLLGEHLGVPPDRVKALLAETGSMIRTIEALNDPARHRLTTLSIEDLGGIDAFIAESHLFDPERPVTSEELARQILPDLEQAPPKHRRFLLGVLSGFVFFVVVAALWRFTALSEVATVAGTLDWAQSLAHLPFWPLAMVGAYVVGGFLMFPVMVLIAVTAIVLGPIAGFFTALAGSLASAAVLFGVGRVAGRRWVRRFGGRFVNRISRRLADQGVLAMAVVRVVPVAPFTVVNLAAGASHLRFRDFMIGTILGMTPGVLAFSLLGNQLERVLRDPSPASISVTVGLAAAAVGLGWVGNRLIGRWSRRQEGGAARPAARAG
jgi:phospholipase D1/2